MKTVSEFCEEVFRSEELAKKCVASKDNLEAFLRENGCGGSVEEFKACIKNGLEKKKDLSDDDLAKISGGSDKGISVSNAVALEIKKMFSTLIR